jgi:hypothetical protein
MVRILVGISAASLALGVACKPRQYNGGDVASTPSDASGKAAITATCSGGGKLENKGKIVFTVLANEVAYKIVTYSQEATYVSENTETGFIKNQWMINNDNRYGDTTWTTEPGKQTCNEPMGEHQMAPSCRKVVQINQGWDDRVSKAKTIWTITRVENGKEVSSSLDNCTIQETDANLCAVLTKKYGQNACGGVD